MSWGPGISARSKNIHHKRFFAPIFITEAINVKWTRELQVSDWKESTTVILFFQSYTDDEDSERGSEILWLFE